LHLENIAGDMLGTRGPAGKVLQAEADLIAAHNDAQGQVIAQVKATMPTEQQGFHVGTQFTAWADCRGPLVGRGTVRGCLTIVFLGGLSS